jgi:hypothetical protein
MTKAPVLLAAALLGLGALSQPSSAAGTRPVNGPPERVAWIVAQGYSTSSGNLWPGPPWAWPLLPPRFGCYDFRQYRRGAWRWVEICE